jgi:hypothetical protein
VESLRAHRKQRALHAAVEAGCRGAAVWGGGAGALIAALAAADRVGVWDKRAVPVYLRHPTSISFYVRAPRRPAPPRAPARLPAVRGRGADGARGVTARAGAGQIMSLATGAFFTYAPHPTPPRAPLSGPPASPSP